MKKFIYFACSLMVVFSACDPMEDVYNELDKTAVYSKEFSVTLSDDDYEEVQDAHYFASEAAAAEAIPAILDAKYPQLEQGSVAHVTYNKVVFDYDNNPFASATPRTVTEAEYQELGYSYNDFSKAEDMILYLNHYITESQEGQMVLLTYDYYASGSVSARTTLYQYQGGEWKTVKVDMYTLSDADYESVGNKYHDFSSSDDSKLSDYFNKILGDHVFGVEPGTVKYVSYAYYSNKKVSQRFTPVVYDGTRWTVVTDNLTQEAELQFKKDANGVWVPDLSIQYTLLPSDYAFIGDEANGLGTAASRANLNTYGNISSYNWTNDQITEALAAVLKHDFPNVEVGQKITVAYDTYPAGLLKKTFILDESGEFVPFEG